MKSLFELTSAAPILPSPEAQRRRASVMQKAADQLSALDQKLAMLEARMVEDDNEVSLIVPLRNKR
jgi:hypothetical protein